MSARNGGRLCRAARLGAENETGLGQALANTSTPRIAEHPDCSLVLAAIARRAVHHSRRARGTDMYTCTRTSPEPHSRGYHD